MIKIDRSHIFVTVLAVVLILVGQFIDPGYGLLWLVAVILLVGTVYNIISINREE